jgi:hypothetical protein
MMNTRISVRKDAHGKGLKAGDWVRVREVPASVAKMPAETKKVFARALGKTFQIQAFDEYGGLELDLWPKVGRDTIWIEPECVVRSRRPAKWSRAFREKQQWRARPEPPRLQREFRIIGKPGVDIDALGDAVLMITCDGALAVWPDERRIEGTVGVEKSNTDAAKILEGVEKRVAAMKGVERYTLGPIVEKMGG